MPDRRADFGNTANCCGLDGPRRAPGKLCFVSESPDRPTRLERRSREARSVVASLLAVAFAAASARAAPEATPLLHAGTRVVAKRAAVLRIAAGPRNLVWEAGPLQETRGPVLLLDRDLEGGRTRVIARGVNAGYGLAATARWVVYAAGATGRRLVARRHHGPGRMVLSRWLAAPIAGRGNMVAWVEQHANRQRVIVRDMSTGTTHVAAAMGRCDKRRCYQIEAVELAVDGVVFTRTSRNPDRSMIVRRTLSSSTSSQVVLRSDPQPDLIPSSAGALYYQLTVGWFRWDFGQSRPRRARFRANPPALLLAYEQGNWLLATRRGCDFGLVVVRGGRRTTIAAPGDLRHYAVPGTAPCVLLQDVAWTGRQALSAWAIVPATSSDEHSDRGLIGVGLASRALR